MCSTCGCSDEAATRVSLVDGPEPVHPHDHPHDHDHQHPHEHEHGTRTVLLEQDILAKNDLLAAANRHRLTEHAVTAINLMSSPG